MENRQSVPSPVRTFDPLSRSLLQKAVRRGYEDIVVTACALLENHGPKEKNWVRKRAVVIAFETCYPQAADLFFNQRYHSKVAALLRTCRSVKNRDATGLGLLGLALCNGDLSVLAEDAQDRHIKILATALRRPDDFWRWVTIQPVSPAQRAVVSQAARFKNIGQLRDQALNKAAAYLAVTAPVPAPVAAEPPVEPFPYWVIMDRHTPIGKHTFADVARDLKIPPLVLQWAFAYFEGAAVNSAADGFWWPRYCRWRFQTCGLEPEEARLVWDPAVPILKAALAEPVHRFHGWLFEWKMEHLERVRYLKQQAELFNANLTGSGSRQMGLFGRTTPV
jgi:hypothetical protein